LSGLITKSINKYKNTSTDNKRLFSNFVSLSLLQAANYLLPLITLPYLVRVLGPDKFGLIAFSQAFVQYFVIITDYGFNLSATREISIHRDNKEKLSEIFSAVIVIKLGLFLISFLLISVIIFSFSKFRSDWVLYYISLSVILGQVLFPIWFFQGIERMKYITVLNIIAKLIFTIAIFIFIKNVTHYIYVPLLNSLGFAIVGIIALCIVFKDFGIKFKISGINVIKRELKEGFPLFLSTASIPLFNETNIVILGIFHDNSTVAVYSLSAKIIGILTALQTPMLNSFFPYISKELQINPSYALKKLWKLLLYSTLLNAIILTLIDILSPLLIPFIFGKNFIQSVNPFIIMSFIPLMSCISTILGVHILVNFNKSSLFSNSMVFTALFNLCIVIPLVIFFRENGAAISRAISELFLMLMLVFYIKKNFKNIFSVSKITV